MSAYRKMKGEPKNGMNGAEYVGNSFWGFAGPMVAVVAVVGGAVVAVWWLVT